MSRTSNRDRILADGLKVMLGRGYVGASVRDIVEAAGVPQGSFSNHFSSKEAFALEVLERYFADAGRVIDETLRNDALPPLKRFRAYIDATIAAIRRHGPRNGCLLGSFTAECGHSDILRKRLIEIHAERQEAVAYCLKAAVKAGELPKTFKVTEVAKFVISGLQGAVLLAKAERDLDAAENFKKVLFSMVLI